VQITAFALIAVVLATEVFQQFGHSKAKVYFTNDTHYILFSLLDLEISVSLGLGLSDCRTTTPWEANIYVNTN